MLRLSQMLSPICYANLVCREVNLESHILRNIKNKVSPIQAGQPYEAKGHSIGNWRKSGGEGFKDMDPRKGLHGQVCTTTSRSFQEYISDQWVEVSGWEFWPRVGKNFLFYPFLKITIPSKWPGLLTTWVDAYLLKGGMWSWRVMCQRFDDASWGPFQPEILWCQKKALLRCEWICVRSLLGLALENLFISMERNHPRAVRQWLGVATTNYNLPSLLPAVIPLVRPPGQAAGSFGVQLSFLLDQGPSQSGTQLLGRNSFFSQTPSPTPSPLFLPSSLVLSLFLRVQCTVDISDHHRGCFIFSYLHLCTHCKLLPVLSGVDFDNRFPHWAGDVPPIPTRRVSSFFTFVGSVQNTDSAT